MDGPKAKTCEARREWVRRIGMCGLLAALTAIVTVLFSYVGALCLAVLVGMMAGTMPGSLGWALRVSFVFPAVMVAMLQLWGVELALSRQLMMGGLSFGMFWLVYFMTLLVISLEAKPQVQAPGQRVAARPGGGEVEVAAVTAQSNNAGANSNRQPDQRNHQGVDFLTLQSLEGEWRCVVPDVEGRPLRKTLRIQGDHFSLAVASVNGEGTASVDGRLKLGNSELEQKAGVFFVVQNGASEANNRANKENHSD